MFDVVIAGAGPAGATAAKVLGEAGVSTLLLDKSAFPRDKPCGGGISARVIPRFPYLQAALAGIPTNWVSKIYFESPSGDALDYEAEEPLYLMIRRYEFDNLLYSIARKNVECAAPALIRKVAFHSGYVAVTVDIDGVQEEIQTKLVLGCDGANSIVARHSGLRTGAARNECAIDMMEETPYGELGLPGRDRMHVFYGFQGHFGYGYVFPKASHINLGVGCKLDYYLSAFRGGHYPHHKSFVDGLLEKQLLNGESKRENFRAFPIPISGPLPETYGERVVLCGDAGGFVNAFTAEGIYYAMVSGEHAAHAAIKALQSNDFSRAQLRSYEREWKNEIGEDLEKSLTIQRLLLADMSRMNRLVRAAARNRPLAELLARYATGAIPYAEFKRSVIRRALPLYIREKLARAFSQA
ncbi:MAG TPA: NAD(P)/FAD-dependent oxidoreductase [Bryobacteraceae bacterium]|nr:NAD(P)/FAD-dependent oxidoreductase [Bryobacteraceae bacterium]